MKSSFEETFKDDEVDIPKRQESIPSSGYSAFNIFGKTVEKH